MNVAEAGPRRWRSFLRKIYLLFTVAAVAGCSHAPPPVVGPAPSALPAGKPISTAVLADTSMPARVGGTSRDTTKVDSARISASDVTKRAAEVFGDSGATRASALSDSGAATEGPSWDIDVRSYETTARVEHYVRMFSGPSKERITARLEEGSRFEPMIRAKMRAGGIPEDMYYLALIESGFNPNAYSRAAAVGMWQFMASTAKGMGLRVDWWVDERRDPVKSTVAAVRFIHYLREQLGSLYLAAAAYNGGPGRIVRGLSRYADDLEGASGDDAFFVLADKDFLPRETREYVPQLIAAALIAKEPERYGMAIRTLPPFEYDSVRVGAATPLAAIASASGATVAQIQQLNPQILRGMTPPRDSTRVRIPRGAAATFDSVFVALPKEERVGVRRVESKKGDYPATIANKYGITARQLLLFNPKLERSKKTGRVAAGQIVLVPTPVTAAAATGVPDPGIEIYARGTRTHVVRRGENLSTIAKKYGTTVASLMRLNGLRRSMIFAGQSLVVSGRPRPAGGRSRRTPAKPASNGRRDGVAQAGSTRGK